MKKDFEIIKYEKIKHIKMFIVDVVYRNFHMHNAIEFNYVLSGSGTITLANCSHFAKEGDLFLYNSNEMHEILSTTSTLKILSLQISKNFCHSYFPQFENYEFHQTKLNDKNLIDFIVSIGKSYFSDTQFSNLSIVSKTANLLHYLFENINNSFISQTMLNKIDKKSKKLENITRYLDQNFLDKISLNELAKIENFSPTYLSHFFKDNIGITIQDYVNNLRFEFAYNLVINTNTSLMNISIDSGFSDIKYLNAMFQKNFGITPKDYRSKHTPKEEHFHPQSPLSTQHIHDKPSSQNILNKL